MSLQFYSSHTEWNSYCIHTYALKGSSLFKSYCNNTFQTVLGFAILNIEEQIPFNKLISE